MKKTEDLKPNDWVFVKQNHTWSKAQVEKVDSNGVDVRVSEDKTNTYKHNESNIEIPFKNFQKYALADVKDKVIAAKESFNALGELKQQLLAEGKKVYFEKSGGKDKNIPLKGMIRMHYKGYGKNEAKVQYQRAKDNPLTFENAIAHNHKLTPEEYDRIVNQRKPTLVHPAVKATGEVYNKVVVFDPNINDIIIENPLKKVWGIELSKEQYNKINNGEKVDFKYQPRNEDKPKTYALSYDFVNNKLYSPEVKKEKAKDMTVNDAKEVNAQKKKDKSQGLGV